MSLINRAIPSLVSGMSQQADELRYSGQAEEIINARLDIATGAAKRPGSEYIARLSAVDAAALRKAAVHIYARDADESYLVVATHSGLIVHDEQGVAHPVNYGRSGPDKAHDETAAQAALAYLQCAEPQSDLRFTTVADYTFVLNRSKKVLATAGGDQRVLKKDTAYLYVTYCAKDLSYTVTIGDFTVTVKADDNDTANLAAKLATAVGTRTVTRTVNFGYMGPKEITETVTTPFSTEVIHGSSVVRIKTQDGSDMAPVKCSDGYGDQGLFVIQTEVARFNDLPTTCDEGMVVSVAGDPETDNDAYWVEYKNGRWQECLKPELLDSAFDARTMPHVLARQSDGQFYFHVADWAERKAGDTESAPAPTFVGRKILDVFYFRNRLGFLSDENVILSRAGKPFMFWRESATMLLDSDPIDIAVSSTRVSMLYHAVPFNRDLVLFSDQAQYILTAQQTLTPKSASITEATSFATSRSAKPQQFGPNLVFPVEREDFAAIREYYTTSDSAPNNAVDLSAHVPYLIPKGVTKMATSTHEDLMVVGSKASPQRLYVYKSYWNGQEKVQSAWCIWDFGAGVEVTGFEFIASRLYVLLSRPDGVYIERIDMSQQAEDGALPYKVSVDRRYQSMGMYSPSRDETVFFVPYTDAALVGVVTQIRHLTPTERDLYFNYDGAPVVAAEVGAEVSTTGGRQIGARKPVLGVGLPSNMRIENDGNGCRVWVKGDWAGVTAIFGVPFSFLFNFGRLFFKDGRDQSMAAANLKIRRMALKFSRAGSFKVRVKPHGREPYEYQFSLTLANGATLGGVTRDEYYRMGEFASNTHFWFPVMSRSDAVDIVIVNDSYIPAAFYGAEWEGFYAARSQRS